MKQKTIKILGTEIAYLDNGSGDLGTILFIHGNSFSSQIFAPQFESALFNDYRLIAIDLYGHGDSGKLSNPFGYHLPNYAKLVMEFIEALQLSNVVLAGHSLGGHVALEVLTNKIEGLVSGVFVWGTPPVTNPITATNIFHANPAAAYLYQEHLTDVEIKDFLANCFGELNEFASPLVEVVKKTTAAARTSFGSSIGVLNFADEISAIEQTTIEVAVAYASHDKFMNPGYFQGLSIDNLWNKKAIEINGSHFCHLDNAESFNQALLSYIESSRGSLFANSGKKIVEEYVSTLS